MTALSTDAVLRRIGDNSAEPEKKLVISPLLDEKSQAKTGQAAIDLRLGFEFCLVTASSFGFIDEFNSENHHPESFSKLYRREYVPFGSRIIIHPHQFMLAQTLEYLRLPCDLMAYVVGRSTWGRLGLIVATAVGVHPGFSGCLTLELRNLGETPLALYPGQTIAQLFFHSVSGADGAPSSAASQNAQYAGTVDMVPHKISAESTYGKIAKLIGRFKDRSQV
jgi:dCTP deaminase